MGEARTVCLTRISGDNYSDKNKWLCVFSKCFPYIEPNCVHTKRESKYVDKSLQMQFFKYKVHILKYTSLLNHVERTKCHNFPTSVSIKRKAMICH